jgi:histidine triad (HIT) family protein
MIAHLSFAIPGERLYETDDLVAIHHPRPSYPVHLLILTKKEIPGLMDLGKEEQRILGEVIEAAQILVRQFDLE